MAARQRSLRHKDGAQSTERRGVVRRLNNYGSLKMEAEETFYRRHCRWWELLAISSQLLEETGRHLARYKARWTSFLAHGTSPVREEYSRHELGILYLQFFLSDAAAGFDERGKKKPPLHTVTLQPRSNGRSASNRTGRISTFRAVCPHCSIGHS